MLLFDWFIFKSSLIFLFNTSVACAGAIPPDLGKLSALQSLKLWSNKLHGEFMRGFGILKKSSLLACSYAVRNNRFLIRNTMNGNLCIGRAWWSVLHHVFSGGMVRLLIEKTQFPTKRSQSPRAKCFHAYPGGEHECYRAWFETATVVVQHRTFSLLCRRLDTPLFVSVMTMGFGRSHDVRVWFVLATTFYVSATHLGQFRGKQLRQIPFKVAFSSRVVVDCVV